MPNRPEDQLPTAAGPRSGTGASYLQRGDQIGPYTILELLGTGGMGVVYAAYDERLDRKVALKLVRSDFGQDDSEYSEDQARLLREAKALAMLSHPNVVHVHDVGTYQNAVYMAMEHVDGKDLRVWFKETKTEGRDWRRALSILMQAGAGLAAAHKVGMVHRDFKPDNVLLGRGDRVYVTDFGLARAAGTTPAEFEISDQRISRDLSSPLTMVGVFVGTPEYTAPERFLSGEVDSRSDQFSFAVTLFEALYGTRPFKGRTVKEIHRAMIDQDIATPKFRDVPKWLFPLVRKGLAVAPEDRYEDMQAFLDALNPRRRARRRRTFVASGVAAVGAVAAVMIWNAAQFRHPLCTGPESTMAGIWDTQTSAALEQRYGTHANWSSVRYHLDRYANQWQALHTRACDMTAKADQRSVANQRLECLRRVRRQLGSFVDHFESAGLDQAPQTLLSYRNPCTSIPETRRVEPETEPGIPELVDAAEAKLAEAKTLYYAGERPFDLAREAVELAEQSHDQRLYAECLLFFGTTGQMRYAAGVLEAETSLRKATAVALEADADELAALAQIRLIRNLSLKQDKYDEAEKASQLAEGLVRRVGSPDFLVRELRQQQAILYVGTRKLQQAYEAQAEALSFSGFNDVNNWSLLNNQFETTLHLGRWEESEQLADQLVKFSENNLGKHPRVLWSHSYRAWMYLLLGNPQAALEVISADKNLTRWQYGYALTELGRTDEAVELLEGTEEDREKVVLGYALALQGRRDEARALVLPVAEQLGTESVNVDLDSYNPTRWAYVRWLATQTLVLTGDHARARELIADTHEQLADLPHNPIHGFLDIELARIERAEGRNDEARLHLTKARELIASAAPNHPLLAQLDRDLE